MREVYLRSPSPEGLFPDNKSDGDLSDTTLCGSLWDQAIVRLDKKQQVIITQIRNDSCKPDELLIEVNKEVEKCESKQWSIYTTRSGRRIFLRDVLGRIAGFLQKVTTVGDALVQYDPWAHVHSMGICPVPTRAVSDTNSYGAFLESMEMVTDTISRYVIIESLYLQPGLDCTAKLEDAIVALYTAILNYLCKAKLYFGHNTMVRVGISILKVEQDASKLMADISSEEEIVEKWMAVNGAQQTFRMSVGVSEMNSALTDFRKVGDERAQKLQNALVEMQKPVCRMASQMDYIYSSIEGNEKARIMRWISSLGKDYETNHSTKARFRLPDSGQWLLRNQKYRHWLNSSSCSVLWLHGGPGYGKSFLVSLVVDRMIQQRQENPNSAYLAYFYCTRDTAQPKRAQPVEILRSIIRQLSCLNSQTPIRAPVIEKWNERVENEADHGLDMDECIALLLDLTRDNPAIICIDALDECDINTRRELLEAIGTVIKCSDQIVKVFVSSRREDDFLDYFEKWEALEISAKENYEDILSFIDEELKKSKANKTLLHGNVSDQLIKDIKRVLLDGADGMFRWVSACLQTLCDPRIVLEREVREALGTLPKQLKLVYDIICSQIERRTPVARTMAENVLKWLLYANKPLSCHEMIKAASMESNTSVDQVLSLCCNFVKLDDEIGVFQFVHLSVREYLENRPEYETSLSHAAIAQSCLQACLTNMKPKRRANLQNSQNKTFYDYAQVFWPLHCQMAKEHRRQPPLETAFRTFTCCGKFPSKQFSDWAGKWNDSWFQMELETRRGAEMGMMEKLNECMDRYRHGNPIFVACVFGFTEIIDDRRQAGMGGKDSTWRNSGGRDPYEVAIRYGQEDVINILRSTTSLDSPAARESALLSAVSLGEMSMVIMLLDDHSDLEITEEIIAAAVSTCNVSMLKFLADRYLDFTPTERLLVIAASNESHGQHIVKFLFEEGGDEIEDIDTTALLQAACDNGPCSLEIVQYLIDNIDDLSVTEDVMRAASQNQFDAYQILRALLKLDHNVAITESIIEAAVRNASAEPLRLLLSRFPTSPVTWIILNASARNMECGHALLTMLLDHSSEATVDEDLLLAAVINEKLALKLLDVLLPRVTPDRVTNDVLKAAVQNRFFGDRSVKLLLNHVDRIQIEPSIIEAASQNLYYAPEALKLLLEYDSAAMVTTTALVEAAANNECGVEALELLLQRRELMFKQDYSSSSLQTDSAVQISEKCFLIPPEVVEAAASNPDSGTEVMTLLLERSNNLIISPKAVENAAGNLEFGEEILALWAAQRKIFEVTPQAIERAAGNHNIGQQVLPALLRCNRRVTISNDALEFAALNPYHGTQMIRTLFPRWKGSDAFEEIIARAARNAQLALPIITYLLKQHKGSITSDIIESCASSAFADKEMMSLLLKAAPGISLGLETVEAASNRPQHFFDILSVLRAHDLNVPITDAAMYNVVRMSFNIVETIQQLKKYQSGLTITEGLMKSVVQNINANEATIVFLCNFQKRQSWTNGILPVTEEVIAAALQNSGNGAVSMVKMLLTLSPAGDWTVETDKRRLEVAVTTYRARAMVSLLVRDTEQHHRVLKVTTRALKNAAQNSALKILLKLLPESDKELITAPEVLRAAGRSKTQLELLIDYAAERDVALPIDQSVFEKAVGSTREAAMAVIKFWLSTGKSALVESCVTEKALEIAASTLRFFARLDGLGAPETSNFHWLFRLRADQGLRIPLTQKVFEQAMHRISLIRVHRKSEAVEYFQRLLKRQGGDLVLADLITTEALKMASGSTSNHTVTELLKVLPEEKRDQLLTRDVLLASAGSGSNDSLAFLLKQKDFQQYSAYYEDISKFHKAAWSILVGTQRALLRRGVYPNAPVMNQGRTMLSFSSGYNEIASVRVFMKFPGFDLDAVDYDGRTALHFACIRGSETVVGLLLAKGADTTIKDVVESKTAEDYATTNRHLMVARMVRDYEATTQTKGDCDQVIEVTKCCTKT